MYQNELKINDLRLVNYKRFSDCKVTLHPSLTVFCGKNGAGKSSILSGVKLIMSWIIARLRNESGVGQYIPSLDVNNDSGSGCIVGNIGGEMVCIPNKAKAGLSKVYALNIPAIKEYTGMKREQLSSIQKASLPILVSYGVKRAVLDMPLRIRAKEYTIFDTYEKSLDGAANFRGFFTWFRESEDWENQQNARSTKRVSHPGLEAFRRAMNEFMPEYKNIHINRRPLRMVIEKNGKTINAEQLSDGEKIYLALIGDLCHRLSLANPNGDPLNGDGIVLIDEVDLHLHPQWQSEVVPALTRTFPNLQFIISTHSPHVLNSVPTDSLRIINENGIIDRATYGYGIPSEIVLGDLMQLSHDVPLEVQNALDNFHVAFSANNLLEAKNRLDELQRLVPQHPELPRMRKRIERMSR